MAFITTRDINSIQIPLYKSASKILAEAATPSPTQTYDIFLSHSYSDSDFIIRLKIFFEEYGFSTYVDWIEDKKLNRNDVNKETADILKTRMKYCRSLVYVYTPNSTHSRWMPWELGYFDGIRSKVVVLPVLPSSNDKYSGQEYLGLYPYIDRAMNKVTQREILWVNYDATRYDEFSVWIKK